MCRMCMYLISKGFSSSAALWGLERPAVPLTVSGQVIYRSSAGNCFCAQHQWQQRYLYIVYNEWDQGDFLCFTIIFQKHLEIALVRSTFIFQYFGSQSGFPHPGAVILLHSSLPNLLKQNIYLVWVLFSLYASGQCLSGKIDFHPHHSCFAE